MEERVSALEKAVPRIEAKLDKVVEVVSDMRVNVAVMNERLAGTATKDAIATMSERLVRTANKDDIATISERLVQVASQGDVTAQGTRLAVMTEHVSHLPSKDFVVKVFLSGFGTLVAVLIAATVMQGKLQAFFGLTH